MSETNNSEGLDSKLLYRKLALIGLTYTLVTGAIGSAIALDLIENPESGSVESNEAFDIIYGGIAVMQFGFASFFGLTYLLINKQIAANK